MTTLSFCRERKENAKNCTYPSCISKKEKEKNVVMSNEHPLASKNNVQERDTNTRKIQSNTNAPPILDCM